MKNNSRRYLACQSPVTTVVLDPFEPLGANFLMAEPLSEILRPLFFVRQTKSNRNEGNEKYAEAEIPMLAAVRLTRGACLWTGDNKLHDVADELNLAMKQSRRS